MRRAVTSCVRSRGLCSGAIAATALLALAPVAAAKLKLPAGRASKADVYTLLVVRQASASNPTASFEMRVCATAKATLDNYVENQLFSIAFANGSTLSNTGARGRKPALPVTDLAPGHCTGGWLTWALPAHQRVTALIYSIGSTTLTWRLR